MKGGNDYSDKDGDEEKRWTGIFETTNVRFTDDYLHALLISSFNSRFVHIRLVYFCIIIIFL